MAAVSEEARFITCRQKEQEQKLQAVAPGPHGPPQPEGGQVFKADAGWRVQLAGTTWTVPGNQTEVSLPAFHLYSPSILYLALGTCRFSLFAVPSFSGLSFCPFLYDQCPLLPLSVSICFLPL